MSQGEQIAATNTNHQSFSRRETKRNQGVVFCGRFHNMCITQCADVKYDPLTHFLCIKGFSEISAYWFTPTEKVFL